MSANLSRDNAWAPYQVRTHNASTHSENRMHSDEVARSFGFKGALVPGVTVFAHMTQPLVARFGEAWLSRGIGEVAFAKPAYDEELLTIRTQPDRSQPQAFELTCHNEDGAELARMRAELPDAPPEPDSRAAIPPAEPIGARPLVTWDLMAIDQPFPALNWHPSREDNAAWCADVRDDLPIYREGSTPLLHPGLVLRQANFILRHRFTLPAWIHTGSRITFHHPLRAGGAYEVRAIPEQKWERKGHQFVRLYVAILNASERVHVEVLHTAIFNPRPSA